MNHTGWHTILQVVLISLSFFASNYAAISNSENLTEDSSPNVKCNFAPKDWEQMAKCRQAAESGDAQAQLQLGLAYSIGRLAPLDFYEAAKWYAKAAEQKNACAMYRLALLYDVGFGIPRNAAEATRLFQAASALGLADAQYALGQAYLTGHNVPQNFEAAVKWLSAAAKQGHARAQYHLGRVYLNGNNFLPRDLVMAYMLFSLAAASSNDIARSATYALADVASRLSAAQIKLAEQKALQPQTALENAPAGPSS